MLFLGNGKDRKEDSAEDMSTFANMCAAGVNEGANASNCDKGL